MQRLEQIASTAPREQVVELWAKALAVVKGELSELVFNTWFRVAEPLGMVGSDMVVAVPNKWGRDWLCNRYSGLLAAALSEVSGETIGVRFVIRTPDDGVSDAAADEAGNSDYEEAAGRESVSVVEPERHDIGLRAQDAQEVSGLQSRYTFDSFVSGDSNQLAYACALAVAETPAYKYNPLFIYGGSGLGKTHLLQAIGHYISTYYPHLRIRYIDAHHMVDDFTDSIRSKSMDSFRRRYRENDVLLVDDIQALIAKKETQEEFFRTFKILHDGHKQIVLTSDRPPYELETLHERLISRFNHGMIADINPPELETRVAILKRKVEAEPGIPVPEEVFTLIAERASGNVRELEGALLRVRAFASLKAPHRVILEDAREVLKGMFPERTVRQISIQTIQNEVCRYFNLSKNDLLGNKRQQNIVLPRQIAMYLSRELTELSLPRIGAEFGGKDHTTVIHANSKITKLLGEKREILNDVQALTTAIRQKT